MLSKFADKSCPKCGVFGPVEAVFGTRLMGGKVKPQSWCRECRKAGAKAGASTEKTKAGAKAGASTEKTKATNQQIIAQLQLDLGLGDSTVKNTGDFFGQTYQLTKDKAQTAKLYDMFFPTDKFGGNRRAWFYCARELRALLGEQLVIDAKALKELNKHE